MLQIAPAVVTAGEKLIHNQARIDLMMLEQSHSAAELARGDQWDREGYNSPYDWIRFNCHAPGNVAGNYLAVGVNLPRLGQSVKALLHGEIGYAQLAEMARTAEVVGKAFDEGKLLPLAKEQSPGKFHYECMHYRHSVDAKAYCEEQSEQQLNHHLSLSTAESGHLLINGVLDPVGGAAVRTALEPLAQPSGTHDDRKREQRFADALVELASAGKPANLQVTATIETLKGLAGAAAGEMEFSLPISSTSVQRIACDCSVTRVLLNQESVTIDVGRSKRVISSTLRKVLKVRDGHCRWPGCERPASWCDGHHLVHWIHGGETNLGNLVLLCRRHHRMVHEGGWQLIKTEDQQIVVIAPTITFGFPRGPD